MTHKHNGGPAFPFGQTDSMSGQLVNGWGSEGMFLRDFFAAKVLAALIGHENKDGNNRGKKAVPTLAKWSYEYADAMLIAREVSDDS